jgi:hypothetical protein
MVLVIYMANNLLDSETHEINDVCYVKRRQYP